MGKLLLGVNLEFVRHADKPLDRTICLSVECGTVEQAARSIEHLRKVVR